MGIKWKISCNLATLGFDLGGLLSRWKGWNIYMILNLGYLK
jgi:hypothetical protein